MLLSTAPREDVIPPLEVVEQKLKSLRETVCLESLTPLPLPQRTRILGSRALVRKHETMRKKDPC